MEGVGRKHPAAPAQTEPLRAAHARQSGPGCKSRVGPDPGAVDVGLVKSPACWRRLKS